MNFSCATNSEWSVFYPGNSVLPAMTRLDPPDERSSPAVPGMDVSLEYPPLVTVQLLPTRIPEIIRDPLRFVLDNASKHGDFIHYPLGLWEVFQVNHPAIIKHILQDNHRNYSKNTIQYNTLSQVTGRGLLTSDGPLWLRQRRLMQPAFHRRRLHTYGEVIATATAAMLSRWDETINGNKPLDVDAEMMQVALEIVGKVFFNLDLRHEAHEMTEGVLEMLAYVVYRSQTPIAPPLSWPTGRNRRYRAAMGKLEEVVYGTIAERRQSEVDYGDVLSMMLAAQDEETGEPMTDIQIRDEMVTLLIAGHETVASALTWAWYLLALNPQARRAMESEIDQVLNGRPPTVDDLPDLPYTRGVFNESLRLYPPAWLITRRALNTDTMGDAVIPPKALIIMNPYVIHRHPAYWPDPAEFDPSRYDPDVVSSRPRFAYIPFGGGPRLCIGDGFALMEGPLILATVAQRFHLDLEPEQVVKVDALVTLRPRDGLLMKAIARQN
jgi:cytochrome P450